MPGGIARLGSEKYVLLTTFRRTGEAVATPVWVATDGDDLVLFSKRDAGKVKRIRHTPRVRLVACDALGRRVHGPEVEGTARVLDADGSERARRVIARDYGVLGRVTMLLSRLRGGRARTVGIAVAVDG
nr:PPOX class F420-dependent oxidoreductase [Saccharomonospora saliphila]